MENNIKVITNDPFNPGLLVATIINSKDIVSKQLIGYGNLDGIKTPVYRFTYEDGLSEDVFDKWNNLDK